MAKNGTRVGLRRTQNEGVDRRVFLVPYPLSSPTTSSPVPPHPPPQKEPRVQGVGGHEMMRSQKEPVSTFQCSK
jgi:hypothetical protein